MIQPDFSFLAARKKAYFCSGLLLLVFLIGTAVQGGFRFGLDFVGGTSVIVKFDDPVTVDTLNDLREALGPRGLAENIRTVAEIGASEAEMREVSIDVRGSGIVDEQVKHFLELQQREGELTPEQIAEAYSNMPQVAIDDLIENFTVALGADTTAAPLYDPETVAATDLRDIFQSLFNANISLTLQHALDEAFPPKGTQRTFDINRLGDDRALASTLALIRTENIADAIEAQRDTGGVSPWSTVDEFIAANNLSSLANAQIRYRLYGAGSDTTSLAPDALSVTDASPSDLAALFSDPLIERFMPTARSIIARRTDDFGGLFLDIKSAIEIVPEADHQTRSLINDHFHAGRFIIISSETVGPTVGADLKAATWKAILFSIIGIILYVWYRFELRFSAGAIAAVVHDTILTIGFIGFFGMEFSIPIVAAILTIIGYSINDTIVVFDRIREKIGDLKGTPDAKIIDLAIHQTISRTIATSATTLAAVIAFLVFGPAVIRDLSIALTFGLIIGTYSTLFIASPVLIEWDKWFVPKKKK